MSSAGEGLSRPLPEQVRTHVVELVSQILGAMPAAAVPPPLRTIAKFEPRKRARLGGTPIAAQLETDKEFREAVAEALAGAGPSWSPAWRRAPCRRRPSPSWSPPRPI
nr:hypothetical protein GCM10020093_112570 [Planobispora longispora]